MLRVTSSLTTWSSAMQHPNSSLLAEGKTKTIHRAEKNTVYICSKNNITAGDGQRKSEFKNKGSMSNQTTCNCFQLLNNRNIPTHYIEQESDTDFLAHELRMIPIEVVIRRLAWGSFLKRNTHVKKQQRFEPLITELFDKDDVMNDPLLVFDSFRFQVMRFHAKKTFETGFICEEPWEKSKFNSTTINDLDKMRKIALSVFLILETAWELHETALADLKIEFGWTTDARLVLGDVVDNDSWRIWPDSDPTRQLDKQAFRDLKHVTGAAMDKIGQDYALVAQATNQFVNL